MAPIRGRFRTPPVVLASLGGVHLLTRRPHSAHHTHQADPPRRPIHPSERLGLRRLPPAAADLDLLGDLTGRYAAGSYSRLGSDGRSVVLRADRQGAADHSHRITAAIACHVARAGGSVDDLTRLLLHPDNEGGRHARHIALRSGQARALDYIRRVWASASAAVASTRFLESRQQAYEVLAALRGRIETTPWRGERGRTALRVLRAHLNFAETAGGPLHHASERQTAEEAGISRTTLRVVYETVCPAASAPHPPLQRRPRYSSRRRRRPRPRHLAARQGLPA
ncbi:hypothetical protein SAMN02787118_12680 [Streptomyces mirabilis]|uniref:Uncharacterized protein n=1 Tax=Streptomyces mirabilis TaxID=68239 RepID=A0A1I2TYX0_9ACTN|nr:hypothetical protein SAMN02787118_12680 [Streptomyces mirabilis]